MDEKKFKVVVCADILLQLENQYYGHQVRLFTRKDNKKMCFSRLTIMNYGN